MTKTSNGKAGVAIFALQSGGYLPMVFCKVAGIILIVADVFRYERRRFSLGPQTFLVRTADVFRHECRRFFIGNLVCWEI